MHVVVSHLEHLLVGGVITVAACIGARLLVHVGVSRLDHALARAAIRASHHAWQRRILAHRVGPVSGGVRGHVRVVWQATIRHLLLISVLLVHFRVPAIAVYLYDNASVDN